LALSSTRKIVLGQSSLPKTAVKGIVALVPVAFHPQSDLKNYKADYTSYEVNKENVPIIDKTSIDQFFEITGITSDDQDYFSGTDFESHKNFPPTYVVTCEFDPLRDDGKVIVKSLRNSGVAVKHDHYDGLPHCFWFFPGLPETQTFMANTFAAVKWVTDKM
jgi:versiconal hemiacetal acetate esterase